MASSSSLAKAKPTRQFRERCLAIIAARRSCRLGGGYRPDACLGGRRRVHVLVCVLLHVIDFVVPIFH
jgi:hypothetical protein